MSHQVRFQVFRGSVFVRYSYTLFPNGLTFESRRARRKQLSPAHPCPSPLPGYLKLGIGNLTAHDRLGNLMLWIEMCPEGAENDILFMYCQFNCVSYQIINIINTSRGGSTKPRPRRSRPEAACRQHVREKSNGHARCARIHSGKPARPTRSSKNSRIRAKCPSSRRFGHLYVFPPSAISNTR